MRNRKSYTVLCNPIITEFCLVLGKGYTCRITAKVLGSVGSKSAPSAANVEKSVCWLEIQLVAYDCELVVLELLKSLLSVGV